MDLEEYGWRTAILDEIGEPSAMLTCDHDAATVSVVSWISEGDDFILDTYVLGWREGEMECSEKRTARIEIPSGAFDLSDVELGVTFRIWIPTVGDTFLVTPDG